MNTIFRIFKNSQFKAYLAAKTLCNSFPSPVLCGKIILHKEYIPYVEDMIGHSLQGGIQEGPFLNSFQRLLAFS